MLNILSDDKFKIKSTLDSFRNDTPNAFSQDEFKIAEKMKEIILGDGSESFHEIDWYEIQMVMKKPIFGFLNTEVVKKLKIMVIGKIEEFEKQEEINRAQIQAQ